MSTKQTLRLAAAALALFLAPALSNTARAQTPLPTGRYQTYPWKLGVDGVNTSEGFVISQVFAGYPATRLGPNYNFALEPGDRIWEVDGREINRDWTLQQALAHSGGQIDFRYWDGRARGYYKMDGVSLVRY